MMQYKLLRTLLILITSAMIAGCATTGNYQQVLSQWEGAKIQDLIDNWGYPDSAVKLPSGNTVYMFSKQQLFTTPAPYAGPTFISPAGPVVMPAYGSMYSQTQTVSLYCRTWFEADKRGVIVNTRFEGNNCIARKPSGLVP